MDSRNPDSNTFQEIEALYKKGLELQAKGRLHEAVACYQRLISIEPGFPAAYYNLGTLLQQEGKLNEALYCYQKVLQINPWHADSYNCIGTVFQGMKRYNEAVTSYKRAIELNPHFVAAFMNLANTYQEMEQYDEAIHYYERSILLDQTFAGSYYNLGLLFHRTRRFREARAYYEKTVEIDPNFADAHFGLALIDLLFGNFQEGWKRLEWRWKLKVAYQRYFRQPLWDGSDIAGRTILLHAEQGFGDAIQFIRYAPLVAYRGAKVIVECQQELVSLFRSIEGVKQVIGHGSQIPEFDVHCPLLSLPLIFDTTLDNIPNRIPYVSAGDSLKGTWRTKIGNHCSKIKVGLVWSSGAGGLFKKKSIPLEMFYPLLHTEDVIFYSLQKGVAATESQYVPKGSSIIDFTDEIHNFADTAALIENLNLVISVDTAVAHLAGALGKETWVLVPYAPVWQWLLDRSDSPWYPTVRLFRQPSPRNWESVIAKVKEEIQRY